MPCASLSCGGARTGVGVRRGQRWAVGSTPGSPCPAKLALFHQCLHFTPLCPCLRTLTFLLNPTHKDRTYPVPEIYGMKPTIVVCPGGWPPVEFFEPLVQAFETKGYPAVCKISPAYPEFDPRNPPSANPDKLSAPACLGTPHPRGPGHSTLHALVRRCLRPCGIGESRKESNGTAFARGWRSGSYLRSRFCGTQGHLGYGRYGNRSRPHSGMDFSRRKYP